MIRWFYIVMLMVISGCASVEKPSLTAAEQTTNETPFYIIGPSDSVNIFVWGNPELGTSVTVRPDGRITTPLIEDVQASGKTPTELARDMEQRLAKYIKSPVVTVTVAGFSGRFSEQIRVVGAATEPKSLPYRENMTLLDVMIAVGGLNEFAAGDRATLVRTEADGQREYRVKIDRLIRDGDISENVEMLPGDILIIPEAWL